MRFVRRKARPGVLQSSGRRLSSTRYSRVALPLPPGAACLPGDSECLLGEASRLPGEAAAPPAAAAGARGLSDCLAGDAGRCAGGASRCPADEARRPSGAARFAGCNAVAAAGCRGEAVGSRGSAARLLGGAPPAQAATRRGLLAGEVPAPAPPWGQEKRAALLAAAELPLEAAGAAAAAARGAAALGAASYGSHSGAAPSGTGGWPPAGAHTAGPKRLPRADLAPWAGAAAALGRFAGGSAASAGPQPRRGERLLEGGSAAVSFRSNLASSIFRNAAASTSALRRSSSARSSCEEPGPSARRHRTCTERNRASRPRAWRSAARVSVFAAWVSRLMLRMKSRACWNLHRGLPKELAVADGLSWLPASRCGAVPPGAVATEAPHLLRPGDSSAAVPAATRAERDLPPLGATPPAAAAGSSSPPPGEWLRGRRPGEARELTAGVASRASASRGDTWLLAPAWLRLRPRAPRCGELWPLRLGEASALASAVARSEPGGTKGGTGGGRGLLCMGRPLRPGAAPPPQASGGARGLGAV